MCDEQHFHKLEHRVDAVEGRLTKVENEVAEMRGEVHSGFASVRAAVDSLAHDLGSRMTVIETRVVTEKEKWGETLRWAVKVIVRVLCALALAAGGITVLKMYLN